MTWTNYHVCVPKQKVNLKNIVKTLKTCTSLNGKLSFANIRAETSAALPMHANMVLFVQVSFCESGMVVHTDQDLEGLCRGK